MTPRRMYNVFKAGLAWVAGHLARRGIIDAHRGERTVDLAWPRIIAGFTRLSQRIADLAMIGVVLGPPALAGMAFAFAYWQIGNQLSLGLSGGSISLVSQRFGIDDEEGIDRVTKQSIWLAVVFAAFFTFVCWTFAGQLIRLLGAAPEAAGFGTVYLRVISVAFLFEYLNKIGSRVLIGVDDSFTPMVVRATGAVANILLNAVFIFGLGLGVFGAALGTVLGMGLTTALFAWVFLGYPLPWMDDAPVYLSLGPPYLDLGLIRELLVISVPLMARWGAHSIVIFPFLAIISVFGSGAVAAFEIGRRIRGLMNAPGWGFSLAASSLVGQHLGAGEETEATAYGWDILRFSIVVYLAVSAVTFVFARPIARVFVDEPGALGQATVFIQVATVAVIWLGIDETVTGTLRGAGDTRWPLYGKFAGLYLVALPVAYLGVVTPLGLLAVYVAFVAETFVPAVVTFYRFRTGEWTIVSRAHRPSPGD